MRRLTVVASVLALTGAAAAYGGPSGVVASASGGYGFGGSAAGSVFDVGPFTWNVEIRDDGGVHGRFNYTQVRDGAEVTVKGSLTCAVIAAGHVWVGGVIEASSHASLVGLDMWFQARDNGEGADAPADMSSTVGAGPPGTARQYCDDHPPVRFPFLVDRGNLQVRG